VDAGMTNDKMDVLFHEVVLGLVRGWWRVNAELW